MDLLHALAMNSGEPTTRFDRALLAARRGDRLADVFSAAYDGAVRQAFDATAGARVALCVTEDAGNSPKAIETRFAGERVHGVKTFVTFGEQAEELLVLATRGEVAGRKDLVIVRVPAEEARVQEVLQTAFMPEISHARVIFEGSAGVLVHEDAWPRVKAFRLVEDVFVLGATLAWLFGLAADHGAHGDATKLAPLIVAARSIAAMPADAPTTHLAYDGLHDASRAVIDEFDWSAIDDQVATRWARDRAVLDVAATARSARGELARKWLAEVR